MPQPLTQKERILDLLKQNRDGVTNYELHGLWPAIFQYPARIKELREDGHDIETVHDQNDNKKFTYVYHGKKSKTDLFEREHAA